MKKIIKSFFIFLLILAVVNVNALNIGDQFSVSIRQGSTKHSSSYQFNQYYQLESATGGGKTYDAYCMDRGNDPSGGRYVGRLLNKHKGDYAVLYILNNGSSDEEIHLAIRTLVSKGILNWGSTANATADYLAEINAKVEDVNPYVMALSKEQTIRLDDEMLARFEDLTAHLKNVLITLGYSDEIDGTKSDNLIKLLTSGVTEEREILYYTLTYNKNLTDEEKVSIYKAIDNELKLTNNGELSL